ncbi:MAG: TonB-dependent receptor plug domain-containing protein, partial [Myxococcaceae bacterium]|nr:TonB-dependent receptor plug domain-containing protein [Myxococcaceae bacterium]
MRARVCGRLAAATLLVLGVATAPSARAQGPSADAQDSVDAEQSAVAQPPHPVPLPEGEEKVDAGETNRTVVTATRTARRVDEQPRAISVVSAEDLERRPARTTPEALLEQGGVFLQKTNHGGGAPIVRGLYGQQVLLLVDGVRMNNATVRAGPNQFLNTVDPFLVEQVEVLRGPGSVLYGSDALGGVVHVRTLWPRFSSEPRPAATVRAQAGSADMSLQGHLRAGLSLENSAISGALTARDFNDVTGGALVGVQRYTGYEEGDAALKLRHRFGPGTQLFLQYQAVRQRNAPRLDRSVPGDFRRFTEQNRDFLHGRLQSTGLGAFQKVSLELSAHRQG